jgi:hypothetical protein
VSACSAGAAALLWAVVAGQRIRYNDGDEPATEAFCQDPYFCVDARGLCTTCRKPRRSAPRGPRVVTANARWVRGRDGAAGRGAGEGPAMGVARDSARASQAVEAVPGGVRGAPATAPGGEPAGARLAKRKS